MKFSSVHILIPALIGIVLFVSCKGNNQGSTVSNEMALDTIKIAKVYHLDNDSTKPSCSLKVNYIIPVEYSDTMVLKKVQEELNLFFFENKAYEAMSPADAANKFVADYIDGYINDAKTFFSNWEDSGETEDYFSYFKTLDSEILFNEAGLCAYQIKSTEFKGGANAYVGYKNTVFNLKNGLPLKEDDIFVSNYKKVLDPLLLQKIMTKNKVKKVEDLYEIGYSNIEDLTANGNFLVDKTGITYIFNQGDYSTPSLGEITIALPYDEIEPILKEDSPISILSGK